MNNIYFKVTNAEEIHHNYAYTNSLNIINKPCEFVGKFIVGDLYFVTIDCVAKYYGDGIYLRAPS